ncbi:hypothetical protein FACS189440_05780 [Bacteroidia bacterium]|nr:hypothetical protein FACS189440_05780 [Bacteroidia bacterium]
MNCSAATQEQRNIAFRRAVYQSSAANFNNVGHLAADGIFTVKKQIAHVFTDQYGDSPQEENPEYAFDDRTGTKWLTFHKTAWLQIQWADDKALTASTYSITSGNDDPNRDPKAWTVEGSNNGVDFVQLDKQSNNTFSQRKETKKYPIAQPGAYKYYRLNITANQGDERIQLAEWDLLDGTGKSVITRPEKQDDTLDSRWLSRSNNNEWIYVDLRTESPIESVKLYWADALWADAYEIQTSNDAKTWKTAFTQNQGKGGTETCPLNGSNARYVRLYCKSGSGKNFSVTEMEVLGDNQLNYKTEPLPKPLADGAQYLRGGNWRVQRASEAGTQDGIQLSKAGFDDKSWLPAKVPGTVLMSYLLAGALPDPNYGDQQVQISDSYFTTDFWYRNHFSIPASQKGKTTWLNFDAINWKADVYFNGASLGRIDGAFIRGRFDISRLANYGGENYLAVFIHKNDNPGPITLQTMESPGGNGGILGADNPTIHASVGWDWVPTIRGRNVGIYNDVFLSYTGKVQIRDPWIIVDLDTENKDFSKAGLTVKTELSNVANQAVNIIVKGIIQPGNLPFESKVITLQANETREVDVANHLIMNNPQLWWPNTYGEQFLYTAKLTAYVDNKPSDKKSFQFGVREYTYDIKRPMTIYCNGTRIVSRGGNWGMDDSNLANTEEDYNIKVRLHAEANLTMIRNWVGMTGNEAFYRACDKYGILIWDDFWLANPGDGPNPNDEGMFIQNVKDKIKRNRHHAALALYCGRNEGAPTKTLDAAFAQYTQALDGTRHYIPHSAGGTVSGFGPYSVQDSEFYFKNTGNTLHSERGMPNVPALESLQKFLPVEHQWPIDAVWGIHDFTMGGAQGGSAFMDKMRRYGQFNDLPSFARFAQLVNFEGHKSMFEAVFTNRANGMLMWMSQSAWPSMVWQTYDYYYDTNGGYFGLKKGNQPVNAIFNFATHDIVLVNATPQERKNLKVIVNVFNALGELIKTNTQTESIEADAQRVISKIDMKNLPGFNDSLNDVQGGSSVGLVFIKTSVWDSKGIELADNFTWINAYEKYNYSYMSYMSEAKLNISYQSTKKSKYGENRYLMTVKNTGNSAALMIRVKTMNEKTNELVLPVYYQDNYFSLMPGESKTISITLDKKHLKVKPSFYVEGWNYSTIKVN